MKNQNGIEESFKKHKEENKRLGLTDKVLYDLCKRYPRHRDVDVVTSKIMLIGRTFNTNIERIIKKGRSKKSPIRTLSEYIVTEKKWKKIDSAIRFLIRNKSSITAEEVIRRHEIVKKAFRGKLRGDPNSFVSKYLHFHVKCVPLFDKHANRSTKVLTRAYLKENKPEKVTCGKKGYAGFVYRYLAIGKLIHEKSPFKKCREIDLFLYRYGRDLKKAKRTNTDED